MYSHNDGLKMYHTEKWFFSCIKLLRFLCG